MASVRAARVVYQVHSTRMAILPQDEIDGALERHPVPEGHIEVQTVDSASQPEEFEALCPSAKSFHPPLVFEDFAVLRRSRWIYRVEAVEAEPENLGYLRSAMLVAGELGALGDGLIVDALAWKAMRAEDIARQIDLRFDPFNHISVHVERNGHPYWVHTHGMEKFAHPDFELHGVPKASIPVAIRLVGHLTAAVVGGGSFRAGEETQLCGFSFELSKGGSNDDHFSHGSLGLKQFRLMSEKVSPAMEGMLACSSI